MARLKGKFIVGTIGAIVYRVLYNKQILQAKRAPGKVSLAAASLCAAVMMGKVSALAKYIRQSLQKAIDGCYDGRMINRLTTEVSAIISQCKTGNVISFSRFSFCGLSGFDFNINSPMRESIGFSPAVTQADGKLIVSLPDIVMPEQLHFPSGASACEINISVSMISLKDNLVAQYPLRQAVRVERSMQVVPAREFTFVVPDGCLCLLSLSLKYSSVKNNMVTLYNNKTFNPVCILDAFITDGDFVADQDVLWLEMPGVNFYQ